MIYIGQKTFKILKWWYIVQYFFKKNNIKILELLGATMITLQNSQCKVWDCDKIIEPVSKQIRKLDYNKLNIKGWK